MKKITRVVLFSIIAMTAMTFVLCVLGNTAYARTKNKPNEYVYYDMDSWRRYLSTEEPNCRHTKRRAYRYVEDNKHAEYCPDCGIVFGYSSCYIDNDNYPSVSDYYHDRCQLCLHKTPYVYVPQVKDTSNRRYID